MTVLYPAESIVQLFTTQDPWSGEAIEADALPTGTLSKNGVATAGVVTIEAVETGLYRATCAVPADAAAGDWWQLSIAATVSGVPAKLTLPIGRSDTRRLEPFFDANGRVDVAALAGQAVALSAGGRLEIDLATLADQAVQLSPSGRLQIDVREVAGSEGAATDLAAGAPRLDANVSSRSSHAAADVLALFEASSSRLAELAAAVGALADEPIPEIAGEADVPPEPTVRQALMLLYMWLRNDSRASAVLRTIAAADGTPALESDLSDDGVTFRQGTLRSPA